MSESQSGQSPKPHEVGLVWRCVVLAVAVWGAFGLIAWFVFDRQGPIGLQAAAIAAGVCWLSGTLALVLSLLFRDPKLVMFQLLFGMAFRMGVPMVAGMWLHSRGGPLAAAGVFGYIVGFYLLTLLVETLLSLDLSKLTNRPSRVF